MCTSLPRKRWSKKCCSSSRDSSGRYAWRHGHRSPVRRLPTPSMPISETTRTAWFSARWSRIRWTRCAQVRRERRSTPTMSLTWSMRWIRSSGIATQRRLSPWRSSERRSSAQAPSPRWRHDFLRPLVPAFELDWWTEFTPSSRIRAQARRRRAGTTRGRTTAELRLTDCPSEAAQPQGRDGAWG